MEPSIGATTFSITSSSRVVSRRDSTARTVPSVRSTRRTCGPTCAGSILTARSTSSTSSSGSNAASRRRSRESNSWISYRIKDVVLNTIASRTSLPLLFPRDVFFLFWKIYAIPVSLECRWANHTRDLTRKLSCLFHRSYREDCYHVFPLSLSFVLFLPATENGCKSQNRDLATIVTGSMDDEDVLCFFLQPPSRRARGGKTIIGRSRTRTSSPRRAMKPRDRFPAAIATACSAWSTIFSITGGSSAVSRRGTIVPTASIGRSIRQTCAPTCVVYILAIGFTWWT